MGEPARTDAEVFQLMFDIAKTDRRVRVTHKEAQAALLHETCTKAGYMYNAHVKSVGAGIYDLWMELRPVTERPNA